MSSAPPACPASTHFRPSPSSVQVSIPQVQDLFTHGSPCPPPPLAQASVFSLSRSPHTHRTHPLARQLFRIRCTDLLWFEVCDWERLRWHTDLYRAQPLQPGASMAVMALALAFIGAKRRSRELCGAGPAPTHIAAHAPCARPRPRRSAGGPGRTLPGLRCGALLCSTPWGAAVILPSGPPSCTEIPWRWLFQRPGQFLSPSFFRTVPSI